MKRTTCGSALLIIMLIQSMVLLYMTIIWRTTAYTYEIAHARMEYEQHYWSMYALMMWAIALCKENFNDMQNYVKYDSKDIIFKNWLPRSKKIKSARARVMIKTINESRLGITVSSDSIKKATFLQCSLMRNKDDHGDTYIVQDWSN